MDANMLLSPLPLDTLKQELSAIVAEQLAKLQPPVQAAPPPEKILSRKEAADYLRVSPVTLDTWTREGIIPAYRLGGRVLYKEAELLAELKKTRA